MHSRFGKRGALFGGLLALAMVALAPSVATAKPEPGAKPRGFRLFARSLGAMTINRIYCGLATTGEICVDSTNSSTIGGGFWPKGTADQYVFNTGLQIAGIIAGDKSTNPWGGDTTGGFFFDPKGTTQHGQQVEPIYNASNPDDAANWPEAGLVPQGDAVEDLYNPLLRGRVSASQGDVWWLSWEGNPSQNAGRPHPLGVVVEQRGLGWNYPTGNEDIIYFTYTFYNITSLNEADYAAVRPSLRAELLQKAQDFHALNNAAFGVTLPTGGYTINELYAAFGADMDVGSAGANYSTVELPFALGNTYQSDFGQPSGWSFDPGIFASPFFPGVGFVGVKYLKSPTGPGEIQLFSNTINGGAFGDARNTTQLWRYLSGNISTAAGDSPCNTGDPTVTRVCYINNSAKADMRFFQSSTALSLPPGGFGTIVVAYLFAAPAAVTSFTPGGSTDLKPGNPLRFSRPDSLAAVGANMVDSLAGFLDYNDANGDGLAQQDEYTVVPGSLLGKALVAQSVFDSKFLLPFSPDAPEFFLVPGDNQVTVLWRPSDSETLGDPFFNIAKDAMVVPEGGGAPVVNPLYDPNYRQFDVEGYRVYRGRVDAPNSLQLLAQFDYSGTSILDYSGFVNPVTTCAPEIGVFTDCAASYDPAEFAPGATRTVAAEYPLNGEIIQVKTGARAELADGTVTILPTKADTALTGNAAGYPGLTDTGVPFVYVDRTVRNNFRYFYSVTAFDVNSFASGPSSLESPRVTKAVTPHVAASNFASSAQTTTTEILGRGTVLNTDSPVPTLDPTTGEFSGPFPPSDSWTIGLGALVSQVLSQSGAISATLDSIQLGSPYDGIPHQYFFTATAGSSVSHIAIPLTQNQEIGIVSNTVQFLAVPLDNTRAGLYGGSSDYKLPGAVSMSLTGPDYAGLYGRGCVNGRAGFDVGDGCAYNGSRWFAGPSPQNNETKADPNAGDGPNFSSSFVMTDYNNAGELPGVTTVFEPKAYQSYISSWRNVTAVLSGARRAADFNVYWGAGGKVDSVIDVTHNVAVPFAGDHMGGTWGILNPGDAVPAAQSADQMAALTGADFQCVEPLLSYHTGAHTCSASGTPYPLSETAVPGAVAFFSGGQASNPTTAVVAANAGFGMYLSGDLFIFELTGGAVPADGTVWSLRSYIGAITGGNGAAGDLGPYAFAMPEDVLPLTATGAEIRANYDVANVTSSPTIANLDKVHTVPDPYYVTDELEQTTDSKVLKFVNLPSACTIRIYSSSGVLVDVIEHNSDNGDGTETWNLRNRNNQVIASGVYFYHVEAGDARRVGRFTVVNFAQ